MGKPKITIKELLSPYDYQPPEVRDNAMVAVKVGGHEVQIIDSYRAVTTINGEQYEVLVLVPNKELKLKGWFK